jgi:hypothetical protein
MEFSQYGEKGVLFSKSSLEKYISENIDKNHVKKGVHFVQSELENGTLFTPCHNSKRVSF